MRLIKIPRAEISPELHGGVFSGSCRAVELLGTGAFEYPLQVTLCDAATCVALKQYSICTFSPVTSSTCLPLLMRLTNLSSNHLIAAQSIKPYSI